MPEIPSWLSEATRDGTSSWVREAEVRDAVERPANVLTDRRVREANKRLQTIHEDEGRAYEPTTDPRELRVRFTEVTRIRKRQIVTVLSEIKESRNVELCFLIDATGSMQPHIDGTRDAIYNFIDKLTKGKKKVVENLRLAMVAYRDHGDKDPPRFEILEFTTDAEEFRQFCKGLVATGGADGPEDVFGGLERAINGLNWKDGFGTKIIFHMADAPCHGREFHNLADDYPRGDPHGLTHTRLFEQIKSADILYYFGKITNHTDIMIKKFAEAYGRNIEDFDVKDIAAIKDSVTAVVRSSVHVSIARSLAGVSRRRAERLFTFVKDEPDWSRVKEMEGVFLTYEMPSSIQSVVDDVPLGRKRPTRGNVKIASNPFAKGSERVAFYGLDVSEGARERIVLKEYLHEGANTAIRHEMHNQMQSIAEFLALEFTEKIRGTTGATVNIKFQKIKTLSTGEKSHLRFLSCEKAFDANDKFIRFSNNGEYALLEEDARKLGVDEDYVRLMMAFSHWTYQASNKNLMVVDLEGIVSKTSKGVEVTLTDPAIHCTDMSRFGQMNHGEEGMLNFFRSHDCNNYCIALGLRAEVV